ncbi:MAG: GntR family transcriptional regulator, partial [Lachnospiraceae bacterium]|nr:GntR family transcriptional regulator [Lachnospiraceae bacterium]
KPGDAIPSIRKLALMIQVTPTTVAKAYQELERQQIIETIRGKGTFIAQQLTLQQDKAAVEKAKVNLESVLMEFKLLGVDTQQMIEMTKELYESL